MRGAYSCYTFLPASKDQELYEDWLAIARLPSEREYREKSEDSSVNALSAKCPLQFNSTARQDTDVQHV